VIGNVPVSKKLLGQLGAGPATLMQALPTLHLIDIPWRHGPYVFRTPIRKDWTPLVTAQDAERRSRIRARDQRGRRETGPAFPPARSLELWISIDGGKSWAQFKGNHFPAVAVRDLAIQPRENDLVLATHGRGIWIVDDSHRCAL